MQRFTRPVKAVVRPGAVATSLVSVLLLAMVACAPQDPAAKVAQARGQYEVILTNFLDRTPPAEEPIADSVEVADGASAPTEGEDGTETPMEITPAAPTTATILFDLVVKFAGQDPLPGLTIEVIQEDASGAEKARHRQWIETGNARRGSDQQVSFEIDGIDLAPGDSFGVSVRSPVPEGERGDYREFSVGS